MKYSDRKNRQRLYLYTYVSYTYHIHITLVVPSRQCLFTYYLSVTIMVSFGNSDVLPSDCCYDSSSGCEKNECATHHDCKHGKVCVPDPNCTGGCICDPGEGNSSPRA